MPDLPIPSFRAAYLGNSIVSGNGNTLYVNGVAVSGGTSNISGLTSIPADVVRITGAQTITGTKDFKNTVIFSSGILVKSSLGTVTSINSENYSLYSSDSLQSVDWNQKQTYDLDGLPAIDWGLGFLYSGYGQSINWRQRKAFNQSSNESLNWDRLLFSGNWSTNTLPTIPEHIINKGFFDAQTGVLVRIDRTGDFVITSKTGAILNDNVVRTTGHQVITGLKKFTEGIILSGLQDPLLGQSEQTWLNGSGVIDIRSNRPILSWLGRECFSDLGYANLNWGTKRCYNDDKTSIDWGNYALYDAGGETGYSSLSWSDRVLRASTSDLSRALYWGLGILTGNWSTNTTPTESGHLINKSYLDSALSSISSTGNQNYTVARHTYSGKVVTYNINNNDNAARGAALLLALSDSRGGDVLSLAPGEFNLLSGRLDVPSGVSLRGAGISSTILRSSGTSGTILCPGSNSSVRDLFISGSATVGGTSQQAVGFNLFKNQAPFTNTTFYNCRFKGEQDAFYLQDPIGDVSFYSEMEFNHCIFESNFDQAVTSTVGVSGKIVFNDCHFRTINTLSSVPVRAVYSAGGDWEWILNNCSFNIGNNHAGSPAVTAISADAVNNSTITLNGGYINIYSGTQKRAFDNAGGTPYSIRAFGVKFLPLSYLGTIDFGSGIYNRLEIVSGREIYSDSGTLSGVWVADYPTRTNQIATKSYVDTASGNILNTNVVRTTGDQTVGGVKTFVSNIISDRISGRFIHSSGSSEPAIDLSNKILSGKWTTNGSVSGSGDLVNHFNLKDHLVGWSTLQLREDFVGGTNTDGQIGNLGWRIFGVTGVTSNSAYIIGEANHPGIFHLSTANSSGANVKFGLVGSTTSPTYSLTSSDIVEQRWIFKLLHTNFNGLWLGYGNGQGSNDTRFIGLRFNASAGDTTFKLISFNAGTPNIVDTAVPVDTNWHSFLLFKDPTGGFRAKIDGGAETNSVGNLLISQYLSPVAGIESYSGASRSVYLDFFSHYSTVNR